MIFPNLGDPISKAAKEMGFYFAVYAVRRGCARGRARTAAERQIGGAGADAAVEPDSSGRIQQVGRLPLVRSPAGTYELRVVVKQGAGR